jgi:hypothetical protein
VHEGTLRIIAHFKLTSVKPFFFELVMNTFYCCHTRGLILGNGNPYGDAPYRHDATFVCGCF